MTSLSKKDSAISDQIAQYRNRLNTQKVRFVLLLSNRHQQEYDATVAQLKKRIATLETQAAPTQKRKKKA